jgi:hypothetical protein
MARTGWIAAAAADADAGYAGYAADAAAAYAAYATDAADAAWDKERGFQARKLKEYLEND